MGREHDRTRDRRDGPAGASAAGERPQRDRASRRRGTVLTSVVSGNAQHGISSDPWSVQRRAKHDPRQRDRHGQAGTAPVPNGSDGIHATLDTDRTGRRRPPIGCADRLTLGGDARRLQPDLRQRATSGIDVTVSGLGAARTDGLVIRGNYVGTDVDRRRRRSRTPARAGRSRCSGATAGATIRRQPDLRQRRPRALAPRGSATPPGPADTTIAGNMIGLAADGDTAAAERQLRHRPRSLVDGRPAAPGHDDRRRVRPDPGRRLRRRLQPDLRQRPDGIGAFDTPRRAVRSRTRRSSATTSAPTVSGLLDRGNGGWGVTLSGVSGATVGRPGTPNVISGNGASGDPRSGATRAAT